MAAADAGDNPTRLSVTPRKIPSERENKETEKNRERKRRNERNGHFFYNHPERGAYFAA